MSSVEQNLMKQMIHDLIGKSMAVDFFIREADSTAPSELLKDAKAAAESMLTTLVAYRSIINKEIDFKALESLQKEKRSRVEATNTNSMILLFCLAILLTCSDVEIKVTETQILVDSELGENRILEYVKKSFPEKKVRVEINDGNTRISLV